VIENKEEEEEEISIFKILEKKGRMAKESRIVNGRLRRKERSDIGGR
jgi:hypothetical protein